MDDRGLMWEVTATEELLHTPIYDVVLQHEATAAGMQGDYIAIEAPDWVMTVAEYQGSFVTVRQYRHSSESLTTEFPGGVADAGEDPAAAAARELYEETGFKAGRITPLGCVNPNPALFKNRLFIYLAEELTPTGTQHLDDDELLTYRLIPVDEVIDGYGRGEYTNALMGTAVAFYLRRRYRMEKDGSRADIEHNQG